jgi:hypothetical protein
MDCASAIKSISLPALVVGVIVGWILGMCSRYFDDRLFGAKLTIDCGTAPGNRIESPDSLYIKFCVRNTKRRVAKNCRAYIVALHEFSNGRTIGQSVMSDSFQIPWAGYDFEPRDIPPNISQYVDLVRFSKNNLGWDFQTKPGLYASLSSITGRRGTYQFTVVVTGESTVPAKKKINVDYDMVDWRNARVYDA